MKVNFGLLGKYRDNPEMAMKKLLRTKNYLSMGEYNSVFDIMYEKLDASSEVYTILITDNENGSSYLPEKNEIYWNPEKGIIDGDLIQSPAMDLLHELGHALQEEDGIYEKIRDAVQSEFGIDISHEDFLDIFNNFLEEHNVDAIETPAAKKLNEPTRENYDDWIYPDNRLGGIQNPTYHTNTLTGEEETYEE